MIKTRSMVQKLTENVYVLKKEIADIKQILKYGNCSVSQRRYLDKRLQDLDKKLKDCEGISN